MVVVGLEGLGRVERLEERLEEGLWEALGLVRCVRRKRRLVGRRAGLRPRSGGHLRQGVVEDRPRGLLRSHRRVGGRVWGSVAS